jgi:ATP-binding cassette subfamily D (ALD) protein 3
MMYLRKMKQKAAKRESSESAEDKAVSSRKSVAVNRHFFERLWTLAKVVVPSPFCREVREMVILTVLLWIRTVLTLRIADLTGRNAEALVSRNSQKFVRGVITLAVLAVPASIVNSGIKYISTVLQLNMRQRLSRHLHDLYLNGMTFYRASNMGALKIDNMDQRITQDTEKFASALASLYGTIFKPVLDIILLTSRLAKVVGLRGPLIMYFYYFLSSILLRAIMPPFAKLTAEQQKLEGDFRYAHSRVINYAEEIAFFGGNKREKSHMNAAFDRLYAHSKGIFTKQATLGVFDSWLVKYGATMIGYAVVAVPVFGSLGVKTYGANAGLTDESRSTITRDYVRNSHILINLARAIGQVILLYKNFTQLAGYTSRVAELREVLIRCVKAQASEHAVHGSPSPQSSSAGSSLDLTIPQVKLDEGAHATSTSKYEIADHIEFKGVRIVSPDKVVLLTDLTFQVVPGMNLLIVGPNGSGKSSLFRVLSGLWALEVGHVIRPKPNDMFYIPQRPYLTAGTLRQQLLYPHSEQQMAARGVTDEHLATLMDQVELRYLLTREGWEKEQDWAETLSMGEQQRIAMARLFYHAPKYAILDECTSQLSLDIEAFLYARCNELNITLITVAHRKSLWKYHSHILIFDGLGKWTFRELESQEMVEDDNQGFNKTIASPAATSAAAPSQP